MKFFIFNGYKPKNLIPAVRMEKPAFIRKLLR